RSRSARGGTGSRRSDLRSRATRGRRGSSRGPKGEGSLSHPPRTRPSQAIPSPKGRGIPFAPATRGRERDSVGSEDLGLDESLTARSLPVTGSLAIARDDGVIPLHRRRSPFAVILRAAGPKDPRLAEPRIPVVPLYFPRFHATESSILDRPGRARRASARPRG